MRCFGLFVWDRTASFRFESWPRGIGDELPMRSHLPAHRTSSPALSLIAPLPQFDAEPAAHGETHQAVFGREHPPGFRWLHERFGSNFRLTELQSAIGRIQLQRLPEWTAARTRNALQLAAALADLPAVRMPLPAAGLVHAWYKFYAFVQPEGLAAGWSHARVASSYIAATGVLAIALLVGGWLWVLGLAGVVLLIGLWLDQRVALAFVVASRSQCPIGYQGSVQVYC